MALVGFHYESMSLDVNKVYFDEGQDIPNTHEKTRNSESVNVWCRYRKFGVMEDQEFLGTRW